MQKLICSHNIHAPPPKSSHSSISASATCSYNTCSTVTCSHDNMQHYQSATTTACSTATASHNSMQHVQPAPTTACSTSKLQPQLHAGHCSKITCKAPHHGTTLHRDLKLGAAEVPAGFQSHRDSAHSDRTSSCKERMVASTRAKILLS